MAAHPSPTGAAVRSALLPGWGQRAAGARSSGVLLLAITLGVSAFVAVAIWWLGVDQVLSWLADPAAILLLLSANLLVAGYRLGATAHAWWATDGPAISLTLALLLAVVVAPHVWLWQTGVATREAMLSVFVADAPPPPAAVVATDDPEEPTPAPDEVPSETDGRTTLLLLGSDAGPGRSGARTDTVMVATIDEASGDAALFGLPRNLAGLALPDGTTFDGILNEVYGWGLGQPAGLAGPDPGAEAVRLVAEDLVGLPIDHWVLVDMTGFATVVDALGGVEVSVAEPVDAPLWDAADGSHTTIRIDPGTQTLDGDRALAYARSRTASDDYDRMARQRCLLTALAEQSSVVEVLTSLPALVRAGSEHVSTDVPLDDLVDLIHLAVEVDPARVIVVGFDPAWAVGRTDDGHPIADVESIRTAVFQATVDQSLATEQSGLLTAGEEC